MSVLPASILQQQRDWVARLQAAVVRRDTELNGLNADYLSAIQDEQLEFQQAQSELSDSFSAEYTAFASASADRQDELVRWVDDETARLQAGYAVAVSQIDKRHQEQVDEATRQRNDAQWLVSSLLDEHATDSPQQRLQRLNAATTALDGELAQVEHDAENLQTRMAERVRRWRILSEWPPAAAEAITTPPQTLVEELRQNWQSIQQRAARLLSLRLPWIFSGVAPFLLFLLMAGTLTATVLLFVQPGWLGIRGTASDRGWQLISGGLSATISLFTLMVLHLLLSNRVCSLVDRLAIDLSTLRAQIHRCRSHAEAQLAHARSACDRAASRRGMEKDTALERSEAEFAQLLAGFDAERAQAWQSVTQRHQAESAAVQQHQRQQLHSLEQELEQAQQQWEQRRTSTFQELQSAHQQQVVAISQQRVERWNAACQEWALAWHALSAELERWQQTWPPSDWNDLWRALPSTPSRDIAVRLGEWTPHITQDLPLPPEAPERRFFEVAPQCPCVWALQDHTGFLVETNASSRRLATQLLVSVLLRLSASLPPGQVRLTIIDAVGLGEAFAALMHLADLDELLVTQRIWTDPSDIEQRLGDLAEHLETVLQMYLRNEYASLAEYNAQAGEIAEPYRVLVIANLPEGMTDLAWRRLKSIVSSGTRCGLIPLISVDVDQPWRKGFPLDELAQQMLRFRCAANGFEWVDPHLGRATVTVPMAPEGPALTSLIRRWGDLIGDVRRVEVPFERIAPAAADIWKESSAHGLEIPVGRAGATKQQSVSLGSGTSQHVLIAGKTGSGKSTLLHALICSGALRYSPSELEFYLIDFKKGVEFQAYARGLLPHARVIAMESDREFGVSVLERLDDVLRLRSELFRKAGAADLPSFRAKQPHTPLPRILLIVDEFQEFFTEDDTLARSASLLLDRLVRQGRGFGVHVVLGSQTLSGAYSLARSTLGQIAVRIALQCSESDAHLILSEENTAARLLTRPGEAIYNAANGASAGNWPFQVVWLGDEQRASLLQQLQPRLLALSQVPPATPSSPSRPTSPETTSSSPPPSSAPPLTLSPPWSLPATIVFEGNQPADLLRAHWWPKQPTVETLPTFGNASGIASQAVELYLGEAVSLQGTTTLPLLPTNGQNLLVVGREEAAAAGILFAGAASAALSALTDRVYVTSASPDRNSDATWQYLAQLVPKVELADPSRLNSLLDQFLSVVRERSGTPGPRIWWCLFDLTRLRALRKSDDDFGFGSRGTREETAAQKFAEILRDGPAVGVQLLIWADSVNTVTRWFSRESLQQLPNRVALAMSATDSSQLLDDPVAGKLGAHRAWLLRGEQGALEKFRPYAAPEVAVSCDVSGTAATLLSSQ
jgi:DNA segregation ATPase FtsK/SpoIIIE, S-DNA-T family